MPSAPAPVRCGARRRTALHGMCLHIWRTVHRGSLELPSPTRHRVGSVHSFTHKSRIYNLSYWSMYWRERTTLDCGPRATARPVRRGPTVPRPTARTAKSVLQRLNASVARGGGLARLGERGLGPKTPSPFVTCAGSCAVVIKSSSIAYRALYAYTLRSTLAKVTVLVLPLPAQPF